MIFVLIYTAIGTPAISPHISLIDVLAVVTYVWNWRLVWLYSSGIGSDHNWMLSHLWSLSVEEQFYIIWPGLLLLALRLKSSRQIMFSLFAVGIIGPAVARLMLWRSGTSLQIYFSSPLHADGLMWGALLAWLPHIGAIPGQCVVSRRQ